ncbi:YggT family protein [Bifidobacterium bombi]|uniref:YggT family protein n=1 Tax=Bifidobacterium bombi DSM 19703 TaxID=1341695 RepID=A0A080N439_9BIFI|nr:YggT family protein [Bifidobacterium bombi]KFF31020.1 YggT family protein [Bifidobacterium bombi DSM 19703]
MMYSLLFILAWVIGIYSNVLLIRVIIDWVLYLLPNYRPGQVVGAIVNVFYVLTDPPLRWLRRYIPPIRLGNVSLDISPLLLWFVLDIAVAVIRILA